MQGTPPMTSGLLSIPGKSSPRSWTIHRRSSAFSARVISASIFSLSAVVIIVFISFYLHRGLLPSPPMLDHDIDILKQINVAQDVATHRDDVGVFALAHRAVFVRDFHRY